MQEIIVIISNKNKEDT